MQCSEVSISDRTVVFDVSDDFFSICPIEESYSGKFFSVTAGSIRGFISQSVMGMIGATGRDETAAANVFHAVDKVNTFVQTSAILKNRFQKWQRGFHFPEKCWQKNLFSYRWNTHQSLRLAQNIVAQSLK